MKTEWSKLWIVNGNNAELNKHIVIMVQVALIQYNSYVILSVLFSPSHLWAVESRSKEGGGVFDFITSSFVSTEARTLWKKSNKCKTKERKWPNKCYFILQANFLFNLKNALKSSTVTSLIAVLHYRFIFKSRRNI